MSWLWFGGSRLLVGVVLGALVVTGFLLWSVSRGADAEPVADGELVEAFELPNVVTGQLFDVGPYLGREPVVVVSYMGFFCPGCEELLVELQRRQDEFSGRGAMLVVIGSEPEPIDLATREADRRGIDYPLLYDADQAVTRRLGLWSDSMEMPFMGYVIVDASGRIAASEQVLGEQPGGGATNVDEILGALDKASAEAPRG